METIIHRAFKPVKKLLPHWMAQPIRSVGTAFITPVLFSLQTGHFRSSLARAAVSRQGDPLPWYTYPCIHFLEQRNLEDKTILEFGGGQSTLWWAKNAKKVVTFESDEHWHVCLKNMVPENVDLHFASEESVESCITSVTLALEEKQYSRFDIVIIDGLFRSQLLEIAFGAIAEHGAIICDNAEGYGFYENTKDRGWSRADFFGYAPGVSLPHCTSIFFSQDCFLFDPHHPIPVIAKSL